MEDENPNHEIAEVFYRLNVGVPVSDDLVAKTFKLILTHSQVKARDAQLGAFLTGLMVKGPTSSEVVTLIRTALNIDGLIRFRPPIPHGERLVGVAGSGKKGLKTFNISTPACIVAATLGVYVAKPGSGATSSLSGSRDFAMIVGAKPLTHQEMTEVLLTTKFGLFPIEDLIPKFDGVYGGKTFGPTPLSFGLPAISNPIVCDAFLYGLSHPNVKLSLEVFRSFGHKEVIVVASSHDKIHYVDELTPLRVNMVGKITNGMIKEVEEPSLALITQQSPCKPEDLQPGESLIENIQFAVKVLEGKGTPSREHAVAMNAAAILVLANKVANLEEGFKISLETIQSGRCLVKLEEFIEATGGSKKALYTLLGGES
jgi:anthranilate phosphoribosyltransferase